MVLTLLGLTWNIHFGFWTLLFSPSFDYSVQMVEMGLFQIPISDTFIQSEFWLFSPNGWNGLIPNSNFRHFYSVRILIIRPNGLSNEIAQKERLLNKKWDNLYNVRLLDIK